MSVYSTEHPGGSKTFAYTANASAVTISNRAGRLCKVLVTTAGSVNTPIYDNASAASGTIIGIIKSTAAVGDVIEFLMPAYFGITVSGSASNAAFTASYD